MSAGIPGDIQRLALTDPSVRAAIWIHEASGLSWTCTLESLVVVLAKQKKELQDELKKKHELTVMPSGVVLKP